MLVESYTKKDAKRRLIRFGSQGTEEKKVFRRNSDLAQTERLLYGSGRRQVLADSMAGHYRSNYEKAKLDFSTKSGLVSKNRLFGDADVNELPLL